MKITNFINFIKLTTAEKLLLIRDLRAKRLQALKDSKIRRKKKKTVKIKKPLKFESSELESIFDGMDADCQKLMAKAMRYKERQEKKKNG